MLLKELPVQIVAGRLAGQGLRVRYGPFNVRINSNYPPLVDSLYRVYANLELADNEIADCHLAIRPAWRLRHPLSSAVRLLIDGESLFPPVAADRALAALDEGLKWTLAARTNEFLVLRTAIVERNGGALLLPFSGAPNPEAALCAVLAHRGYRLLADTFGLLAPVSATFCPLPGPIALSNADQLDSQPFLSLATQVELPSDSEAEALAYVCPSPECISRAEAAVTARWIVLPQKVANAPPSLEPLTQSEVFLLLVDNSLNYATLGEAAFVAVNQLLKSCQCYRLVYSDYGNALAMLSELTDAA